MPITQLLIANRGEIAVRIARSAADLGIPTVAIHATDDAASVHVRRADRAVALPGSGAAAYLDTDAVVAVAQRTGCDAVHPGYGFLSERADAAEAILAAGLTFVGPPPAVLRRFGDKAAARALAIDTGVPVMPGTGAAATADDVRELWDAAAGDDPSPAVVIKATAGGGGRGMRVVTRREAIDEAWSQARAEAGAGFGHDEVYAERLVSGARHIEVQVVADGTGAVAHLGERECTLQRRHQKLVEVTPSPSLTRDERSTLVGAATSLAAAAGFVGVGTFEFLVAPAADDGARPWFFLEANPRLQVEHTITEEVTGIDLVRAQLLIAGGTTLADLGLSRAPVPGASARGRAVQLRINTETIDADGTVRPSTGRLQAVDLPGGPGVRVDAGVATGAPLNPRYDTLAAKVIVHIPAGDHRALLERAARALAETRIEGAATNVGLLGALLHDERVLADAVDTGFVDRELPSLLAGLPAPEAPVGGATPDPSDATDHGDRPEPIAVPDGAVAVTAPMEGTVVAVEAAPGDLVRRNQPVVVIEAMKMQHPVPAPQAGHVGAVAVTEGMTVRAGDVLAVLEPTDVEHDDAHAEATVDLDHIRPDLAELLDRLRLGTDEARPEAVAKRAARGHRTGRTNVEDLVDAGSFIEYGALAIAAQRRRRPVEELIEATPADGLITGIGTVNAEHVEDPDDARTMVLAYDYSVLAGTQGVLGHKKLDRMLELARRWRLPTVLFAEGGGGRPGDTDWMGVAMLDTPSFIQFARLSGLVPVVGIVAGRCFAGNAALLGCCDVIIATESASIGMGGPAMIEGGGLGSVAADDVGPVSVQAPNGVIDVVVADEAEAVDVARRYLGYFQGRRRNWDCDDQRHLRHLIPEDRLRSYDMRAVIDGLADTGSVLELRAAFGTGIITALIRIEGRPFGVIANNPRHLGGAIDAPAADKAARFLQLCDAHGLPVLSLCDTPGFMVGPESEKTATVRHVSRLFVTAGALRVPFFTVVTRKGYGLGAQAMAAGSFHTPMFTVAWPSGEFGAMGLEGAVRLGFRKELEAIADPAERDDLFRKMVELAYDGGKALNMASYLEIDAVIDPVETRRWLLRGLAAAPPPPAPTEATRRFVDTW